MADNKKASTKENKDKVKGPEPVEGKKSTVKKDKQKSKDIVGAKKESKKVDDPKKEAKFSEKSSGKKVDGHIIITKPSHPEAKWYVVHTMSGHEGRVAQTLKQRVASQGIENRIFEILVPTQDRVIIRSGKKSTIKEKIFPGYMLIKARLNDQTWLAIRTTPGITGFVGSGNKPAPLSEKEVSNIQKFIAEPAKRFKTKFSVGEAVKITDGPFNDFLGTINEMDEEKGKVKVLVSIFGRETPVELDFLQITKV